MKKTLCILALATLVFACKKDSDPSGTSTADFYFVGKVDGATLKMEQTPTNDVGMTSSTGSSLNPPDCTFSYGTSIGSTADHAPYFGVNFPGLFQGNCGDEKTLFPTLFPTGAFAYAKVEVEYFDGTQLWSSAKGAQPAGATFNVTKSEQVTTPLGGISMTVSGSASCTLFDDSGASKKLESGSFKLNFTPYF